MNVVAHAGSVRRGVIVSKYDDLFPLTQGHLQYARNQMMLGLVIFPPLPVRRSASRIEIAQADTLESMQFVKPLQHPLDQKLGFTIGTAGHNAFLFLNG